MNEAQSKAQAMAPWGSLARDRSNADAFDAPSPPPSWASKAWRLGQLRILPDLALLLNLTSTTLAQENQDEGRTAAQLAPQSARLYQGGLFQRYQDKVGDDVRSVCIPHLQTTHFGVDSDSFIFPRTASTSHSCARTTTTSPRTRRSTDSDGSRAAREMLGEELDTKEKVLGAELDNEPTPSTSRTSGSTARTRST